MKSITGAGGLALLLSMETGDLIWQTQSLQIPWPVPTSIALNDFRSLFISCQPCLNPRLEHFPIHMPG